MPKRFIPREHYHRDSRIFHDYGNTRIRELRLQFGPLFARPCNENVALREVWDRLDVGSIRQLILDVEDKEIKRAAR